jgi:hypothetical protein
MHGPKGTRNQEKNSARPVKRYVRLREPLWGAKRSTKSLWDAELLSAMEGSATGGKKRGYLLPQIGGVAEPREFVALQGIARSSEKEFPTAAGCAKWKRWPPERTSYLQA